MEKYNLKFEAITIDEDRKHKDFKLKWISDGGWRGVYDAIATKKSGWIRQKEHSDWITGDFEDAGHNAESKQIALLNNLATEYQKESKEMAVVFSRTSNIFSTGFDVFTRVKQKTTAQDAI